MKSKMTQLRRSTLTRTLRSRISSRYTRISIQCSPLRRSYGTPKDPNAHLQNSQAKEYQQTDVEKLLSTPSWSVESLLPPHGQKQMPSPISSKQLYHLLRLSALPQPKTPDEEAKMLDTLASQLHFVKEIQKVDTAGVIPLRALRDETEAGEKEGEITLDSLREALSQEEVVGKHHRRVRRNQDGKSVADNPEGWRPLEHAQRTAGKFFIVNSGQGQTQ